jgi:hypothetical protein
VTRDANPDRQIGDERRDHAHRAPHPRQRHRSSGPARGDEPRALLSAGAGGRGPNEGNLRIPAAVKAARPLAVTTLDDFDFGYQRSVRTQVVLHLAQLDFLLEAKKNVIFLGPPAPAVTHLSIAVVQPPAAATWSRSPPPT